MNIKHTVTQRFLKYVQIDTQSDPLSPSTPSTNKQKNLGNILVKELKEIGADAVEIDENGYVYATIPSNTDKEVPAICFCSHMDTSPDCSGQNVKPIIHKNYQGQDIVLPDDKSIVIKLTEHPDLKDQIGNDIITASGTTLLGADNKAGIAAIMDATNYLINTPEIKHGDIKILFTPDEEIGRGVDKVNLQKLNAKFGYTIDGETLGSFEDETFSADGMEVIIHGVSAHPGFAKGKMVNAIKIASEVIAALPKDRLSPESTDKKLGFVHPTRIEGEVEKATISFIIRDFEDELLEQHENEIRTVTEKILQNYPEAKAKFVVKEQYRNMKKVIAQYPQVSEYALEAIKRSGLTPKPQSIRGGTDGSRLSFMGLPCPNIFAGEHAFHSKQEWVSVQDMEAAVRTIVNLASIWEERA
ncbi:peptidase T [Pseudopedobacter saltans DSM 12145]|uniref:Peptidase T n=1 Tax=Pseudopedobacter saltans (strain ATCC 51119 / DSM 12145 / JCM 21818 / CCUG 39354 / LMG 10337 / NBRC 100064 / NCIMB 13643) TaxID=762903 RepID=F0S8X5_PSESL|nr:peptidase T [Pseudopedobacter saltans]ADY53462.1 peptidase T [Pseudopedobacter saltans DSM 12145]